MKNISMIEKNDCTGCSACMNACNLKAIEMKCNEEGFLYPKWDKEKCDTSCSECFDICPIFNKKTYTDTVSVYAAMASVEIRKLTASGGVFHILATYVLDNFGAVVGAAWTENRELKHKIVEKHNDLSVFHDIKYIESDLNDVFTKITKILNTGKLVLFSGFDCQIKGLLNYLKIDYPNLITYEIFCRGIPSKKLLNQYINDEIKTEKITDIKFRDKSAFGWGTTINLKYGNDLRLIKRSDDSNFWKIMQKNIASRESCYSCEITDFPRAADFSSCDFWEVEKILPEFNDKLGTSMLFANSKKAKTIITKLITQNVFLKIEKIDSDYAIKRIFSVYNFSRPEFRNDFYRDINKYNLDDLIQDSDRDKYDVGIVGYWYALNYGSALTYYALYYAIKQLGLKPAIVETTFNKQATEHKDTISRLFMRENAIILPHFLLNESHRINKLCNAFVVGSDQVWTADAVKLLGHHFFLDFVSSDKRKVSYASSFGKDSFSGNKEMTNKTKFFIQQFDAVSVRETSGVDLCRNLFHVEASHVLDPVFLLNETELDRVARNSNKNISEPYIFAYILDINEEKHKIIEKIKEKQQVKVILVTDVRKVIYEREKIDSSVEMDVNVYDWVYYFKNANYVITDSHHGLVMSILFKREFACIMNSGRGATRFISLMNLFNLRNRLIYSINDVESILENEQIDYPAVCSILEKEKSKSTLWLANALNLKLNEGIING